jgi:2-amino-4-hydroxy-6-hydroxymethyldihydropteridine diphosphokinase
MPRALVALGANLGDRVQTLQRAVERIAQDAAQGPLSVSGMHETAPVGGPAEQNAFLNAAVAFETSLEPAALHAVLKRIEHDLGRVRGERWGARAIDLDLLLYDGASSEGECAEPQMVLTAELQVPHPRMSFRRFVLEPAVEVAPQMIQPLIGWSVEQLLDHLNHAPQHVAVVGLAESRPEELARAAATQVKACFVAESPAGESLTGRFDLSGPAPSRPIQFRDRIASVLAAANCPPATTLISAFCVEESEEAERPLERSRQKLPSIVLPIKLLIVLDDWASLVAAKVGTSAVAGDSHAPLRWVVDDYQGPILCAGRSDFESQLNEITAAVVAMR